MSGFQEQFNKAKTFSDFLAFHVRFLFCVALALIALAVPVTSLLSPDKKIGVWAWEDPIGILLFFVMMGYAIVMWVLIVRTGIAFINERKLSKGNKVIKTAETIMYLLIQAVLMLWIMIYGGYQTLRLTGVNWQTFVCQANTYLNNTDYPMTPPRPAYCD